MTVQELDAWFNAKIMGLAIALAIWLGVIFLFANPLVAVMLFVLALVIWLLYKTVRLIKNIPRYTTLYIRLLTTGQSRTEIIMTTGGLLVLAVCSFLIIFGVGLHH